MCKSRMKVGSRLSFYYHSGSSHDAVCVDAVLPGQVDANGCLDAYCCASSFVNIFHFSFLSLGSRGFAYEKCTVTRNAVRKFRHERETWHKGDQTMSKLPTRPTELPESWTPIIFRPLCSLSLDWLDDFCSNEKIQKDRNSHHHHIKKF